MKNSVDINLRRKLVTVKTKSTRRTVAEGTE